MTIDHGDTETLTFKGILQLTGGSTSWLYNRIKDGSLPKPWIQGQRSTKGKPGFPSEWDLDEIVQWRERQNHLWDIRKARNTANYGLKKERAAAAALLEKLEHELAIYDFVQPEHPRGRNSEEA